VVATVVDNCLVVGLKSHSVFESRFQITWFAFSDLEFEVPIAEASDEVRRALFGISESSDAEHLGTARSVFLLVADEEHEVLLGTTFPADRQIGTSCASFSVSSQ